MRPLAPGSALARALERERGRYNARVALARRRGALDLARLARVMAEDVSPVVAAVEAAAPNRVDAATEALFELALELLAAEVLGHEGRHDQVHLAWRELLPRLDRHVAEAPRRVAAAVTNASVKLEAVPPMRAAEWREALGALSGACPDAATLLACGQVLAWRAGMAHWRESALEVWEALPEPLARAALGLPPDGAPRREELRRALADPFRRPGSADGPPVLRVLGRVGGFRGFGGPFLAPPRLLSDGARIWAMDGEEGFTVHADCFGTTVVRTPGSPQAGAPEPRAGVGKDGTVMLGGLRACFPELAGARASAAAGGIVAVLPQHTHRLVLVARTPGEESAA